MHGLGGSIHGYYGYVTTGLGFGVTLNCGHVPLVVRSEGGVTLETVDVSPSNSVWGWRSSRRMYICDTRCSVCEGDMLVPVDM